MSPREKRTVRIIGERNIYLHLGNPAHHESITKIGKALSSPLRLKILDMLRNTARHAGLYLQHPVLSLRNLRFLHRLRQ